MKGIPDLDRGVGFQVHLHWLSEKFPDVAHVYTAFYRALEGRASDGLGWVGNIRLSVGRMPKQYPASYAHLFVGAPLDWFTERTTGQSPGGWTPHWMGIYAGEPWSVRGGFADDRDCQTPSDLGLLIAHEVGHLFVEANEWHRLERDGTREQRLSALRLGASKARAWSERLLSGAMI